MYTTTALIAWALIALVAGFAAGWLVGLFRWKNNPVKAEAESTAIRDGWHDIEQRFQAQIDELKSKVDEQAVFQPQGAQSEAPKKDLTDALFQVNRELPMREELTMSEPLNDLAADSTSTAITSSTVVPVTTSDPVPSVEAKEGVHDFEAALHFVRDGVKKLGDAAEDELVALAKKYL